MSVIKAILFYSNKNERNKSIKRVIENLGPIGVDFICVDSQDVRDRLLEDDEYQIQKVPSVLILYSSGKYKVYTEAILDEWVSKLIENVLAQQQPAQHSTQQYEGGGGTMGEEGGFDTGTTTVNVDDGYVDIVPSYSQEEATNPMQSSMIAGSIVGGSSVKIESDPLPEPAPRKEIKKDSISAVELAKKMQEEKEEMEEMIEKNRPFPG